MPILKLHAENIGPFDRLELDLSDGNGKAHLGPHILAGVNGSGKTTILRTIAWCLATGESGFDHEEWMQFLRGRANSRALLVPELAFPSARPSYPYRSLSTSVDNTHGNLAHEWASKLSGHPIEGGGNVFHEGFSVASNSALQAVRNLGSVVAYAPRQSLRRLDQPSIGRRTPTSKSLAFDGTVSNEAVQAYWIDAFSREAVVKTRGPANGRSALTAVAALRSAVSQIIDPDCEPDVNVERSPMQPILRFRGTELSLSQLPAGFNATLGWVVDYLARQDAFPWLDSESAQTRPGLILIDEIETHLHPQWQRRVLSGIRSAFPNTQIIVTTHSPFVISSCPGSRVHVLALDQQGKARVAESADAPTGASLMTSIKEVFGIWSEFGLEVENRLDVWNDLKKRQAVGALSDQEATTLAELTQQLAAQGEELASIVADPPVLPQEVIDGLVEAAAKDR